MKENFEPDIYRDNLAEEIKETAREDREKVLEEAKENPDPEYWKERNKRIEKRQGGERVDNGLGIFVKKKTLYHGTGISDIKKFKEADDTTVGEGLYCTSRPKDAINYAHHRSGLEKPSILYEIAVENLKLLDIRNNENIKRVMRGYKSILQHEADKTWAKIHAKQIIPSMENSRFKFFMNAIRTIDSGELGIPNIQDIIGREGKIFTEYVRSLGYDGLITIEGGEGDFRKSNHDSYVIFDPEKVKIVKEQKIKKEEK